MRNFSFLFLVLFSINTNAQSDSIVAKRSVVALDKVKTIYRGIANPISIAVSDCKSFTVEGAALREVAEGKYTLSPGVGNEAKIVVTITNYDDSISIEEHIFSVKNRPIILAKINDQNCYHCVVELTKEQIRNSIISVGWNDVNLDLEDKYYEVSGFTVFIINLDFIKVIGNRFSEESIKEINKLKVGEEFYILKVRYPNPTNSFRMDPNAIKIRINE